MLGTKDLFLTEVFEYGILDLQFFFGFLDKLEDNDLHMNVQDVIQEYGGLRLNIFISEALYLLAEGFFSKYYRKIEELLNVGDFDGYREKNNELYETFINLLDSHVWFHNDRIQNLFENSEFYYR